MKVTLKSGVVIEGDKLRVTERDGIVEVVGESGVVIVEGQSESARMRKLLSTPVSEMNLSPRAANALSCAGICTIGQLVVKTEVEMIKWRNFGKCSLNKIKEELSKFGLSLGMNIVV